MNVLFLCTGNSARSLIAQAVFNARAPAGAEAFSAGSQPRGQPHPDAIRTLQAAGYATDKLRSKSWDEFDVSSGPELDLVVTLCDDAASESCPVWPGAPGTLHWGLPDPAAVEDHEERGQAFRDTLASIEKRVLALLDE